MIKPLSLVCQCSLEPTCQPTYQQNNLLLDIYSIWFYFLSYVYYDILLLFFYIRCNCNIKSKHVFQISAFSIKCNNLGHCFWPHQIFSFQYIFLTSAYERVVPVLCSSLMNDKLFMFYLCSSCYRNIAFSSQKELNNLISWSLVLLCYRVVFLKINYSCGTVSISAGFKKAPSKCIKPISKEKVFTTWIYFIFSDFRLLFEGVNIMTDQTQIKVINKQSRALRRIFFFFLLTRIKNLFVSHSCCNNGYTATNN